MKTRDITFLGIGIALFVALSMCLRVPIFENYYLCLGYVVMTVYAWCYGKFDAAIIGFCGVILYCIIGGLGFNGMPGWALGNIFIGLALSYAATKIQAKKSIKFILMTIVAIAVTFVGIEIIKSLVDMVIVAQPFTVRFISNITSFIADAFVIIISFPICLMVEKPAKELRYK